MKLRWIILMASLTLIVAGCRSFEATAQPVNTEVPQASPTQLPSATPAKNSIQPTKPSETTEMPVTPLPANKFVDLAKRDLASHLNIEIEQITLRETMEIDWPDASLGCPSPGKVYAQGRVPGYKIWLETGGEEYIYHTDLTGQVILCADPYLDLDNLDSFPPTSSGPTQDPNIGVPID